MKPAPRANQSARSLLVPLPIPLLMLFVSLSQINKILKQLPELVYLCFSGVSFVVVVFASLGILHFLSAEELGFSVAMVGSIHLLIHSKIIFF